MTPTYTWQTGPPFAPSRQSSALLKVQWHKIARLNNFLLPSVAHLWSKWHHWPNSKLERSPSCTGRPSFCLSREFSGSHPSPLKVGIAQTCVSSPLLSSPTHCMALFLCSSVYFWGSLTPQPMLASNSLTLNTNCWDYRPGPPQWIQLEFFILIFCLALNYSHPGTVPHLQPFFWSTLTHLHASQSMF